MLDILFVTFNSEKWIDGCIQSLSQSTANLKEVSLYFVDNASTDGTVAKLHAVEETYGETFAQIRVHQSAENLGFGRGNNLAAKLGKGEVLFCLNIDTTVYPDTLQCLLDAIAASDAGVGAWEARQMPYEHPKMYDPLTGETTWASGAALAVRRSVFEEIGGFDESIFMYAEDVDLSWRIRAKNYTIHYLPGVVVNHYAYQKAGEVKPTQYVYSILNNLLLRTKFGSRRDIVWWHAHFASVLLKKEQPFQGARRALIGAYVKNLRCFFGGWRWKKKNLPLQAQLRVKKFVGWDYEGCRDGVFYEHARCVNGPKVSVIVRTCGRPSVLRETLISLRRQTYRNFEVVVVEDGAPKAERMIREEFDDLNIVYQATGKKVGRSSVGNRALSLATGQYFNFLDDDDVFYADHLEVLVGELTRHPAYKAAYSLAFETPILVHSRDPYVYELLGHNGIYKQPFNRLVLVHHNYFPIQCVMFDRSVYEARGGFDEALDILEDWDLWVRYAAWTPFLYVHKTTSMYRVPAQRDERKERQQLLDDALAQVHAKFAHYATQWSVEDIFQDVQQLPSFQAMDEVRQSLVYRFARKVRNLLRKVTG